MIELRDFSTGYGDRRILDHVDTTFGSGSLTALIGRNGSGKSTLLRAMAGLNPRYTGEVIIDGTPLRAMKPAELARSLAFVTTERTRIPNLSCEDVTAIGRAPYTNWIGKMQEADREIVSHALKSVGMEAYARRTMDTMSDGECQRVMIARALAQSTPAILLDEPTSFLDLPNRYELVSLLKRLVREEEKCIIFSTHELDVAMQMCDSIALIDNGGSLLHLPVGEMAASGHIQRLFNTPDVDIDNLLNLNNILR